MRETVSPRSTSSESRRRLVCRGCCKAGTGLRLSNWLRFTSAPMKAMLATQAKKPNAQNAIFTTYASGGEMSYSVSNWLEVELGTEFDGARLVSRRTRPVGRSSNGSGSRRGDVRVGNAEAWVVEDVKGIGAELHVVVLPLGVLPQAHVPILVSWSTQHVVAGGPVAEAIGVAVGWIGGKRAGESRRIEPIVKGLIAGIERYA